MMWQLVLVLVLAGFGFCVLWTHVLLLCRPIVGRIWQVSLPEAPLLGGSPLYIRDGEHLPELLSYERELAKTVGIPPQSVSGIIPITDSVPTEDAVQYDTVCLHAGYDVPDARGSQKVLLR